MTITVYGPTSALGSKGEISFGADKLAWEIDPLRTLRIYNLTGNSKNQVAAIKESSWDYVKLTTDS